MNPSRERFPAFPVADSHNAEVEPSGECRLEKPGQLFSRGIAERGEFADVTGEELLEEMRAVRGFFASGQAAPPRFPCRMFRGSPAAFPAESCANRHFPECQPIFPGPPPWAKTPTSKFICRNCRNILCPIPENNRFIRLFLDFQFTKSLFSSRTGIFHLNFEGHMVYLSRSVRI